MSCRRKDLPAIVICHICRLPIPRARSHNVLRDPLAFTKDHVTPRSKGGTRTEPAHRHCNEAKGNRDRLSLFFVRDMQNFIMKKLVGSGERVTNTELAAAREAIEGVTLELKALRYSWNPVNRDFARWADDGGRVLPW